MDSDTIWKLFTLTGAPAAYLLYRQAKREEEERERMPASA